MNTYEKAIHDAYEAVNGVGSPMSAYARLRALQAEIESAIEAVKDSAIAERQKYGKETIVRHGFELEIVSGRKVWSYKHGTAWSRAEAEKKRIEKLMQSAYETGSEIADATTGEIYEPASLTFANDTLKATYKP
jgi:multidrug resistance efflux pump